MNYIGIDPGASGGIAVLDDRGQLLSLHKIPPMLQGLCILMERWSGDVFVMVEKVGGFMGAGYGEDKVNVAAAHTMFEFGRGFGHLEALLVAMKFKHEFVMPTVWQRYLDIEPKCKDETKTQWKNRLKVFSQGLYSNANIILPTADALLIAHYCYKTKRVVP